MTQAQEYVLGQLNALAEFLESPLVPAFTMNVYQLEGYLRAVSLAPGDIEEQRWLSLIFNEQEPAYQSSEQRVSVLSLIRGRYSHHCLEVAQNLCRLPCAHGYARLQGDRVNLEQWARGALQGYIVCEDEWSRALAESEGDLPDQKIDGFANCDEFDAIVAIVSTVADAKYAVEMGADVDSLPALFESFPDSVVRWGALGRRLRAPTAAHHPV